MHVLGEHQVVALKGARHDRTMIGRCMCLGRRAHSSLPLNSVHRNNCFQWKLNGISSDALNSLYQPVAQIFMEGLMGETLINIHVW